MARLSRYTQSIFGSTAGSSEMAQYGSFANGSPATYSGSTITPTIVQSLANYLSGWFSAVEGAYSPAIEDMNSLCYLFAYQLTYLMQVGLPEWDSGTTYYIGDLVQSGGTLYASLTNSNLNNLITDGTNWFTPAQAGMLTMNTMPYAADVTLVSGQTLTWPNLEIVNGQMVSVPTGAYLLGASILNISGTGILNISGTGTVRIL